MTNVKIATRGFDLIRDGRSNIDDTDESNFNLNDENVIEEIELNDTEDGKMIE